MLGPEDCAGGADKRKAQRVAWDAETDETKLLSQPPQRIADQARAASQGTTRLTLICFRVGSLSRVDSTYVRSCAVRILSEDACCLV